MEAIALDKDALAGVRVVELSGGRMGAACSKFLADFGADVVKVEPPGGDPFRRIGPFVGGEAHPERSAMFLYLNANKRGVCLDLGGLDGRRDLDTLLKGAHVFVTDLAPREARGLSLDGPRVEKLNPDLVYTSVTHFGRRGPYSDHAGADLVAFHREATAHDPPRRSPSPVR